MRGLTKLLLLGGSLILLTAAFAPGASAHNNFPSRSECGDLPSTIVDEDGDGLPFVLDPDDDCDFLADETEQDWTNTGQFDADTDNDGEIDGRDLAPRVDADVRLDFEKLKMLNSDWLEGYPDPYVEDGDFRLGQNSGVVGQFDDLRGLAWHDDQEDGHQHGCEGEHHYHDKQVLDDRQLGGITVSIPDDVARYNEKKGNPNDFPALNNVVDLREHDHCDATEKLDAMKEAGRQPLLLSFTLYDVGSNDPTTFKTDGGRDGDNALSVVAKVSIESNVAKCAVDASTDVRHGDDLVQPRDLRNDCR